MMNDQLNNNPNNNEDDDEWGHHAEVPEDENALDSLTNNENENEDGNPSAPSADDLRQMANSAFANKDFDTALHMYTAALETFESELENGDGNGMSENNVDLKVIYLCNRATCLYRMEMFEESRADALEAVNVSNGE